MLEPPFAAAEPVAPNRPLLLVAILFFALGAGGAIAFGLNQLKPVFFNRHALTKATGFPVLGSVSMIISPKDHARRKRQTVMWAGANFALLVACGVIIVLDDAVSRLVLSIFGGAVQ